MKEGRNLATQAEILKLDWDSIIEDFLSHLADFHPKICSQEREELCFHVVEKVLSGSRPWDSHKYPNILNHLAWCAESEVSNARSRAWAAKRTDHVVVVDGEEENLIDSFASTNLDLEEELLLKEKIAILEESIMGDSEAEDVYTAYRLGACTPREAAEIIGISVDLVNTILRRIRRRAAKIRSKYGT